MQSVKEICYKMIIQKNVVAFANLKNSRRFQVEHFLLKICVVLLIRKTNQLYSFKFSQQEVKCFVTELKKSIPPLLF